MKGQSIRLRVFGREFPVRVHGDTEHARRVAARVDDTMNAIARMSGRSSAQEIAILAALNLADEIERAKSSAGVDLTELEAMGEQLTSAVERAEAFLAGASDE
jgi:cell division protein ZapA